MSFLLASAARATVGARSGQEDAFRLWPAEGVVQPKAAGDGLLAVLADGMGGHAGGAVAGQTACAMFTEMFAATATPYEERLDTALRASNDALAKGVEQNAALRGMGCTLVAAWIDGSGLRWTSVGDSLLLLYRFPDVIRLNADHSLGAYLDEQARQQRISVSEAKAAPNRNALRSALTGSKVDLVDLHGEPLELRAGDWVLLASDGIASLAGDELADVIYRYRQSTPDEMAEGLIGAVARKGVPDQDNTTVVAVRVDSDQQADDGLVTTRILRPDVANAAPGGNGRSARAARPPTFFGAALEISPAVWLGAAAGLLLVAVVLAMRMLPLSAPPPPTSAPAPAHTGPQWPAPSFQKERPPEGASPPSEGPSRPGPAPQFLPSKPSGEADRSGPRPIAPKDGPPLPAVPVPSIPARPQMEAPDPLPKTKKEAEPTTR
jgi:serine/threonine protein phosphatase PrpC